MSEIKVQISDKPIAGGYSFSASSNVITLTCAANQMSEPEYNAIVAEATLVRELYIQYNNENKSQGKKESPSTMKSRAVVTARAQLQPQKVKDNPLKVTEVSAKKSEPIKQQVKSAAGEFDPLIDALENDDSIGVLDVPLEEKKQTKQSQGVGDSLDIDFGDFGDPFTEESAETEDLVGTPVEDDDNPFDD